MTLGLVDADVGAPDGRPESPSERRVDAVVHILGVALGVAACVNLAIVALPGAPAAVWISLCVYGLGLLAMLGCSAVYNISDDERWRRLDHAAIFVMIAGTYTPFTAVVIDGAWGIGMLILVWSLAAAGVVLKLLDPERLRVLSIAAYLGLGWIILVALEPLTASVSATGLRLLGAGGILYSAGVVFYLWKRLPYRRVIWHMFVLIAGACHYVAVVTEVAPTA